MLLLRSAFGLCAGRVVFLMSGTPRVKVAFVAVAMALMVMVGATTVDAVTCSSACNQIRKSCIHVSKAVRKIAQGVCSELRDTCRVDCEATTPEACTAACSGTCAPEDLTCPETCADDCWNCRSNCNDDRVLCRDGAKTAGKEAKLACGASRETCRGICVDPIDGQCVVACKAPERNCKKAARLFSKSCKKACAKGPGRRACISTCKKQLNEAYKLCSGQASLCVGGCIGLTP